jgi:hypothetical protein
MSDLTARILEVVARLKGGESAVNRRGSCLRPGDPDFPETVARLLALPLAAFAEAGEILEVRVPWHSAPVYFAPDKAAAQALIEEGQAGRGEAWTARELLDLLGLPDLTPEQARSVALAKVAFAGEVVEVRGR